MVFRVYVESIFLVCIDAHCIYHICSNSVIKILHSFNHLSLIRNHVDQRKVVLHNKRKECFQLFLYISDYDSKLIFCKITSTISLQAWSVLHNSTFSTHQNKSKSYQKNYRWRFVYPFYWQFSDSGVACLAIKLALLFSSFGAHIHT